MDEAKHTPFDQRQLNAIKKKLFERKEELEEQLAELYKDEGSVEFGQDIGDRVQSLSMETLKTSLQDTEIAEYNMIRNALQMIDDGTYGICTECGQEISEKQLSSTPMQHGAWCAKKCLKNNGNQCPNWVDIPAKSMGAID